LQINLNIAYKFIIIIGFLFLSQPGLDVAAQAQTNEPDEPELSVSFVKPEIFTRAGDLSFNIIKAVNNSDSSVRFKPIIILPENWSLFSTPYNDTVINPHDSISLLYRFKVPENVSSEVKYEVLFRSYSKKNKLLSETICQIFPEPVHNWQITIPENRVFFSPRSNQTEFNVKIENNGNIGEEIDLQMAIDKKLEMTSAGPWQPGKPVILAPFQDTVIKFNVKYVNQDDRVFDLSKVQFQAVSGDKLINKPLMIEKYNDTYAPFVIDRSLPHQAEIGFRTFSKNDKVLPFIKARGLSSLKNQSTFAYNFNYYALTGNENFISNTYYNFLYSWKTLQVGLGAFSSQLGRNMYTRNGIMVSNIIKLSPSLYLEAFLSQSILTPKTSIATGFTYKKEKLGFHGSVAYDLDLDKGVNTGSVMLQSTLIPIFKHQDISFNIYGYHEAHDLPVYDYTLAGVAWDLNYFAKIGDVILIQLTNNYGSPNVPGPQMGLFNFGAKSIFMLGDKKKYISIQYINSSRKYYNYSFEGIKLPGSTLNDQYSNLIFHTNKNPNHIWEAGPSIESYVSYRPAGTLPGSVTEYRTQKLRFEYKGSILKKLTLNMKTGLSNILIIDPEETNEQRYDFHLLGGYNFASGFGISFTYDYGPMVNSGLYQFAGDAKNHSLNFGPSVMDTYFNERLVFNLFANLVYRVDLDYSAININPKLEAYLLRDWYLVMSGTYHYNRQKYPEFQTKNSYVYFECSLKKRWGKSEFNKWQKDTRKLKVILFKDDNGDGIKDELEKGVPYVKTRLVLTNSDNPNISTEFPVDITLLSNEKGTVYFNKLPTGFYDLNIVPLSDVKEYFYVNKSVEKLQLSKNMVYYVPFQKATKIAGKLVVERQKFIKKGTESLNLTNIKITAYTNDGNSYSSFTLEDGSFNIFVPGNNSYYLRMGNVFGSGFKILKNDILINVTDTASEEVVFNIQEITRQVKFKETKPVVADTSRQEPLKIKVLQGKFYENSSNVPVDKDAMPEFNIKEAPVNEVDLIPDNYYVVIGIETGRTEAIKLIRVVAENGIEASLGYQKEDGKYYVFTKHYDDKSDAREELDRMKQAGLNEAEIIKF
jgi:hypothetical protein